MQIRKVIAYTWIVCSLCLTATNSQAMPDNNFGQTIQIQTRLHSFLGKPSWLIVIRDVDHNQNIPYVFDITRGNNFWLLFTYSRNYLISASNMQMSTYRSRYNTFGKYQIDNFCQIESGGRIAHGESMIITITGDLTPYSDTIQCHVSRFADANFGVAITQ